MLSSKTIRNFANTMPRDDYTPLVYNAERRKICAHILASTILEGKSEISSYYWSLSYYILHFNYKILW